MWGEAVWSSAASRLGDNRRPNSVTLESIELHAYAPLTVNDTQLRYQHSSFQCIFDEV
jgi:hypothetical protein